MDTATGPRGYIYRLTSPSGKSYIGQTRFCVKKRWQQHERMCNNLKCPSHCTLLGYAIRKYGFQNFRCEVLGEYSHDQLNEQEVRWIAELHTTAPTGYNLTPGGWEPMLPEVRERISKKMKGVPKTMETRKRMGDARRGQPLHPATRAGADEAKRRPVIAYHTVTGEVLEFKQGIDASAYFRRSNTFAHSVVHHERVTKTGWVMWYASRDE